MRGCSNAISETCYMAMWIRSESGTHGYCFEGLAKARPSVVVNCVLRSNPNRVYQCWTVEPYGLWEFKLKLNSPIDAAPLQGIVARDRL